MREIDISDITKAVRNLSMEANYRIGDDLKDKVKQFLKTERSGTGKEILASMLENYELAESEGMAVCQDTGVAVVFALIGQDVHITGGSFAEAINEGIRQGYSEGCLRKSIIIDPVFKRLNTNDNTPAVIHTEIVAGDRIEITFMPKGSGAENMSEVRMLKVSDGLAGLKKFVIEKVQNSGGKPCPPIIVGIGVGGNFERCAVLSKKALLREVGKPSTDRNWAQVEADILEEINSLGIGPQGLGGLTTALAVQILTEPCHIASLPVAVNIQCHANRHKTVIL